MAYRGRFFMRQRVWGRGTDYVDADVYPVFQAPGKRRKKCRPTREIQEKINQRDAVKKFKRIANLNFRDGYELDLTVREPMELKEAVVLLRAYYRRIRRKYRKGGAELKYMYVQERGKLNGRAHFHMLISAGPMSRDELEDAWGLGTANCRRLQFDENGIAPLTEYLNKSRRQGHRQSYRRWTCSKNLVRPEPEMEDVKITVSESLELADAIERRDAEAWAAAAFPGYTLVEAEAIKNLFNRGTYIRLRLAKPETWHGRRPIARYISGETGEDYAQIEKEEGGAA